MGYLTREQILKAADTPTEVVSVPEWGGDVLVRGMTGKQRDALEAEMVERKGKSVTTNMANFRAKLVARCIMDESGVPVFHEADAELLGEKSAAALGRVFDVAMRLSGFSAADVDELTKN